MSAVPESVGTHHDDPKCSRGGTANDHVRDRNHSLSKSQDLALMTMDPDSLGGELGSALETTGTVPWWIILWVTSGALINRVSASLRGVELETIHSYFDGRSKSMAFLNANITRWEALAFIYKRATVDDENDPEHANFWYGMTQGAAVRNRFRMVLEVLRSVIRERYQTTNDTVILVSIACGSAAASLEAAADANAQGIPIEVHLVDKDEAALAHAKAVAEQLGIENLVHYYHESARVFLERGNVRPDIVEVAGLLDYFTAEAFGRLCGAIHAALKTGGTLVATNVAQHWHQAFLVIVMGWKMIHRSRRTFKSLLGQHFHSVQVVTDPLGGHHLGICKK